MRRIDRRARGPGLDLAVMNHPSALRFPFREIANQVRAESRMVKVGGFNAKYAKDAERAVRDDRAERNERARKAERLKRVE